MGVSQTYPGGTGKLLPSGLVPWIAPKDTAEDWLCSDSYIFPIRIKEWWFLKRNYTFMWLFCWSSMGKKTEVPYTWSHGSVLYEPLASSCNCNYFFLCTTHCQNHPAVRTMKRHKWGEILPLVLCFLFIHLHFKCLPVPLSKNITKAR